jgi:hypothetical protein
MYMLPLDKVFSLSTYQDIKDYFDLLYLSSNINSSHFGSDVEVLYDLLELNWTPERPIMITSKKPTYPNSPIPNIFSHRTFQYNEEIIEGMISLDCLWDNIHHSSCYLPMVTTITPPSINTLSKINILFP